MIWRNRIKVTPKAAAPVAAVAKTWARRRFRHRSKEPRGQYHEVGGCLDSVSTCHLAQVKSHHRLIL